MSVVDAPEHPQVYEAPERERVQITRAPVRSWHALAGDGGAAALRHATLSNTPSGCGYPSDQASLVGALNLLIRSQILAAMRSVRVCAGQF